MFRGELASSVDAVTRAVEERFSGRLAEIERRFGSVGDAVDAAEDDAEERREALYGGDDPDALTEEQVRDFRLNYAILHASQGWANPQARKSMEYRAVEAWKQRAALHSASDDDALGLLVPPQVAIDRIIMPLEARIILGALGASVERPTGDPYIRPRITGLPTASWEGENTSAQDTSTNDDQMVLRPHRVSAVTTLSKRLMRETSATVQQKVTDLIVNAIRRKVDLAGFKGSGAQGAPVGILNTDGILSVDWSGVTYTGASQTVTDKLEEMIGKVEDADAYDLGSMKWAMHPQGKRKLRKVKDGDGKPMLFSVMRGEGSQRINLINDLPFETSTQLASGATADLLLGTFSALVMALWENIRIDMNDRYEEAWRQNKTGLLVQMEVDFGLEYPEAFVVGNSFDASGA